MRRIAAALLTVLALDPTALATAERSPLAALQPLGQGLEDALQASLEAGVPKAFAPLSGAPTAALLGELKAVGAARVRLVGFELELNFLGGGGDGYYLRTFVHATRGEALLLSLSGRSGAYRGHAPEAYKGPAAPVATAAAALVAALQAGRCQALKPRLPKHLRTGFPDAERLLKRGLKAHAETCPALPAAVAAPRYSVRIDDVAWLVLDRQGQALGTVKGGMELRRGKIVVEARGFRPLRP